MTYSVIEKAILNVGLLRVLSIVLAGTFVSTIVLYFPPEEFGKYSLAFSIIQISCATFLSWPNQAFLRFGRQSYRETGNLGKPMGARLVIHGILSVFMFLMILVMAEPVSEYIGIESKKFLYIFLAALLFMPASEIGLFAAQACGRFRSYGLAPVFQRGAQLLAIIAVIIGYSPDWVVLLGFSIVGYIASAWLAWMDIPKSALSPIFSFNEVCRTLRYAWALPAATLGAFLLQSMDVWFISFYVDRISVGQYAWAYTLILMVTTILVSLAAVIGPKVIDLELDQCSGGLESVLNTIFSICMLLSAALPLALAILSLVGNAFIPKAYIVSLPILLVLATAMVFQAGMAFVEPLVYAKEKIVSRMTLIVLIMVLVKALVNFLLIKNIGIVAAAISTVFCYGVGMVLLWRLISLHVNFSFWKVVPVVSTGFVVMVFALIWQGQQAWYTLVCCSGSLVLVVAFRHFRWLCALPLIFERAVGYRVYRWLVRA